MSVTVGTFNVTVSLQSLINTIELEPTYENITFGLVGKVMFV